MAVSEKQRKTVLEELELGKTLRQACVTADVPEPSSILFLVKNDESFASQYAHAREVGYQLMADGVIEVADDTTITADHRRIMVDTRKWLLSKALPKIYGERLDLHHSGSVSKADQLSVEELQAIVAKDTPQA